MGGMVSGSMLTFFLHYDHYFDLRHKSPSPEEVSERINTLSLQVTLVVNPTTWHPSPTDSLPASCRDRSHDKVIFGTLLPFFFVSGVSILVRVRITQPALIILRPPYDDTKFEVKRY